MFDLLHALNGFMGTALDGGPVSWLLSLTGVAVLLSVRLRGRR